MTDRYADNGLVAVAISKVDDGVCDPTVETVLLAKIADAKESGAVRLQGRFIPTKKNAPGRGVVGDGSKGNGDRDARAALHHVEEHLKPVVHVELLVTMKQGEPFHVRCHIDLDFLATLDHHYIFHYAGRRRAIHAG